MGGGHGGHGEMPPVPNWRVYKVEDAPQLQVVRKALATANLKNPWLRNNVWLYTEYENNPKLKNGIFRILFKGFKFGLVAAAATTMVEHALFTYYYGDDDGHDHH